jgi:hypothetical protein
LDNSEGFGAGFSPAAATVVVADNNRATSDQDRNIADSNLFRFSESAQAGLPVGSPPRRRLP